jgi:hypothetical protein
MVFRCSVRCQLNCSGSEGKIFSQSKSLAFLFIIGKGDADLTDKAHDEKLRGFFSWITVALPGKGLQ